VCSVILSYNSFEDTDECLRSLLAQDHPRHQVIIVDNASSQACREQLRAACEGRARLLENAANLGVAAGYNAGIRAALEAGADFVVLCNNDVYLEPNCVRSLLLPFEGGSRVAIAVPIIPYYDRPDLVWFARIRQHPLLFYTRNLFRDQPLARVLTEVESLYQSDFVPTCASMLSRAALEDVGLLDDRFFFGNDDVDWCFRARRKGYSCVVVARPLARHKVSVAAGVRGSNILRPAAAYTYGVGSVLMGAKHFRRGAALPFLVCLLALRAPYTAATMARAGRWASVAAYLRGLAAGFIRYGGKFLSR
jgi:GT2 family glycosyltransferase